MVLNPLLLLPSAACEQLSSVLHPSQLVGISPRTTARVACSEVCGGIFRRLFVSVFETEALSVWSCRRLPRRLLLQNHVVSSSAPWVGFLHRLQDHRSGSPPDPHPLVSSLYRHTELPNLTILRSVNTQHVAQIKISQSFSQQCSSLPS